MRDIKVALYLLVKAVNTWVRSAFDNVLHFNLQMKREKIDNLRTLLAQCVFIF